MIEQVKELFLAESMELLLKAEDNVLELEKCDEPGEIINDLFRSIHSIKGSAGMFGFSYLEKVLHVFETLIGEYRTRSKVPESKVLSVLLRSLDFTKSMILTIKEGNEVTESEEGEAIIQALSALSEKREEHPLPKQSPKPSNESKRTVLVSMFIIELSFQASLSEEFDPTYLFKALAELGSVDAQFIQNKPPEMKAFTERPYFGKWLITIEGEGLTKEAILEVFAFVEEECTLHIEAVHTTEIEVPISPDEDAWSTVDEVRTEDGFSDSSDNDAFEDPFDDDFPEIEHFPEDDHRQELEKDNDVQDNRAPTNDKKPMNVSTQPSSSQPEVSTRSRNDSEVVSSIRVNVSVLEQLMNLVSELILNRNQLTQLLNVIDHPQLNQYVHQLNRLTSEIQETSMRTRMQPIKTIWARLPRIVRDLSLELNKEIELKMEGETTELDRQVMQHLSEPLTHIIRNSIDHGIESVSERMSMGKSAKGTIQLNAYHESGYIIIEIQDDGKGLDVERIKEKALSSGLKDKETIEFLSDQQIQELIFLPGFSTSKEITTVSGRGVGMDVVKTNIEHIGGSIELYSEAHIGTKLKIKIPLTLAIVSALIFKNGDYHYAIPELAIQELVWVNEDNLHLCTQVNNAPVFKLRDSLLPLVFLSEVTQTRMEKESLLDAYIIVTQFGRQPFGIVVDQVDQIQEIVVKSMSKLLNTIPIYSGATIVGNNDIVLILDVTGIARTSGLLSRESVDLSMSDQAHSDDEVDLERLLLFTHGKSQKAIPLSLVSRLEKLKRSSLQQSDDDYFVTYREHVLPLLWFKEDLKTRDSEDVSIIVFDQDGFMFGIIVEEYEDIVEAPLSFEHRSNKQGVLGVLLLENISTEVIDVGWYYQQLAFQKRRTSSTVIKRVLVCERSSFLRNHLKTVCQSEGVKVLTASTWDSAVELLQHTHVDGFILGSVNIKGVFEENLRYAHQISVNQELSIFKIAQHSHDLTPEKEHHSLIIIPDYDKEAVIGRCLNELLNEEEIA